MIACQACGGPLALNQPMVIRDCPTRHDCPHVCLPSTGCPTPATAMHVGCERLARMPLLWEGED